MSLKLALSAISELNVIKSFFKLQLARCGRCCRYGICAQFKKNLYFKLSTCILNEQNEAHLNWRASVVSNITKVHTEGVVNLKQDVKLRLRNYERSNILYVLISNILC